MATTANQSAFREHLASSYFSDPTQSSGFTLLEWGTRRHLLFKSHLQNHWASTNQATLSLETFWSLPIQSKLKSFTWRTLPHKNCPPNSYLHSILPDSNSVCVYCRLVMETTDHLFTTNSFTRQIWFKFPPTCLKPISFHTYREWFGWLLLVIEKWESWWHGISGSPKIVTFLIINLSTKHMLSPHP